MGITFDEGSGCPCCNRWRWALAASGQECQRMEGIAMQLVVERDEALAHLAELLAPASPPAAQEQP